MSSPSFFRAVVCLRSHACIYICRTSKQNGVFIPRLDKPQASIRSIAVSWDVPLPTRSSQEGGAGARHKIALSPHSQWRTRGEVRYGTSAVIDSQCGEERPRPTSAVRGRHGRARHSALERWWVSEGRSGQEGGSDRVSSLACVCACMWCMCVSVCTWCVVCNACACMWCVYVL